jgi:hypothetical protein
MRKHNSLFNQVCQFINSQPVGSTFNVSQLNNAVTENYTAWKRRYKDPYYATRTYAGLLRNAGVLAKYQRGTWTVLSHIPENLTLHMVNNNLPYNKRWKALVTHDVSQVNNTINPYSVAEDITIYVIVDKHVEPTTVLKTKVGALLSTGSYFEDEMDAWYFLSIGTGVAVESLKADWQKSQDIAKGIVELTKQAEAAEAIELMDAVERLDGLLTITDKVFDTFIKCKFIYKLIDTDDAVRVFKYKVPGNEYCKNNMNENESLLDLLRQAADEVDVDIEDIIDENLQLIESEIFEASKKTVVENADDIFHIEIMAALDKQDEKREDLAIQIAKDEHYIKIEDIKGREVFYKRGNEYIKGTVLNFTFTSMEEENFYSNVKVKLADGSTGYLDYKTLFFSKEDVIKSFTETINSL